MFSATLPNPAPLFRMKMTQAKTNRITHRIAAYLVKGMRPFSTVEEKEFRNMFLETDSRYRCPNRSTFAEEVIPSMYQSVYTRVREDVQGAIKVGITLDSWTSRATESFITITAHYITKEFQQESVVLQTRQLKDSHTGLKTAEVIKLAEEEWAMKVVSLTTDNASNMRVAAQAAELEHVGCFAHVLNLAACK